MTDDLLPPMTTQHTHIHVLRRLHYSGSSPFMVTRHCHDTTTGPHRVHPGRPPTLPLKCGIPLEEKRTILSWISARGNAASCTAAPLHHRTASSSSWVTPSPSSRTSRAGTTASYVPYLIKPSHPDEFMALLNRSWSVAFQWQGGRHLPLATLGRAGVPQRRHLRPRRHPGRHTIQPLRVGVGRYRHLPLAGISMPIQRTARGSLESSQFSNFESPFPPIPPLRVVVLPPRRPGAAGRRPRSPPPGAVGHAARRRPPAPQRRRAPARRTRRRAALRDRGGWVGA